MQNLIRSIIRETLQQAEKAYLATGKLSSTEIGRITAITHGDGFTKFLCALMAGKYGIDPDFQYEDVYTELKTYNKNVFPIQGWEKMNEAEDMEAHVLYQTLKERKRVIALYQQLPSIAIRNFKTEARIPRDQGDMQDLTRDLGYFIRYLSFLDNRTPEQRDKVYAKMFSSKNKTLRQWTDFMTQYSNYTEPFSDVQALYDLIPTLNVSIVQDTDDVIVLAVYDHDAIKTLGCNSRWCFAYPGTSHQWRIYSTNDMIYYIFDKNNFEEQYILISPDELYGIDNTDVELEMLDQLKVDRSKLTFQPA